MVWELRGIGVKGKGGGVDEWMMSIRGDRRLAMSAAFGINTVYIIKTLRSPYRSWLLLIPGCELQVCRGPWAGRGWVTSH